MKKTEKENNIYLKNNKDYIKDKTSNESKMEEIRKIDFSPRGRRLEHQLAKLFRKEINNLDVSEEEKENMKEMMFDYLLEYEKEYKRYYQTFKEYGLPPPGLV